MPKVNEVGNVQSPARYGPIEEHTMIFKADLPIVQRAELIAGGGSVTDVLTVLRRLTLMDFGRLLLEMPNTAYPNLSRLLPKMAPAEVQTAWTGSSGYDLFRSTEDFGARMQHHFERICGRGLRGATILDYGCGWGRIARLMLYFTDPERLHGVDPMTDSIKHCRECGVLGNIALSAYLPTELPVGDTKFDLAYAYSVFTHTSKRATQAALSAIRSCMKPDGLLVITIRPVEIWDLPSFGENADAEPDALVAEFERTGFAFLPNKHFVTDDDYTYGVTTISPDWIVANCPDWKLVAADRGEDHLQYLLFLQPK